MDGIKDDPMPNIDERMICLKCEFLWGKESARRDGCSCEEEEE